MSNKCDENKMGISHGGQIVKPVKSVREILEGLRFNNLSADVDQAIKELSDLVLAEKIDDKGYSRWNSAIEHIAQLIKGD